MCTLEVCTLSVNVPARVSYCPLRLANSNSRQITTSNGPRSQNKSSVPLGPVNKTLLTSASFIFLVLCNEVATLVLDLGCFAGSSWARILLEKGIMLTKLGGASSGGLFGSENQSYY